MLKLMTKAELITETNELLTNDGFPPMTSTEAQDEYARYLYVKEPYALTLAEFVQMQNWCNEQGGLPPLAHHEEASDYEAFLREGENIQSW